MLRSRYPFIIVILLIILSLSFFIYFIYLQVSAQPKGQPKDESYLRVSEPYKISDKIYLVSTFIILCYLIAAKAATYLLAGKATEAKEYFLE